MILGHVRDRFARITLSLRGLDGPLRVEFLVDTGFDGDLSLPLSLVSRMETSYAASRRVRLADGYESNQDYRQIMLSWDEDTIPIEVLVIETNPLIGVLLMEDYLLQAEMQEEGEVSLEPL